MTIGAASEVPPVTVAFRSKVGQAFAQKPVHMKVALVVHDLHERGGHSLYTRILADQLSHRHDVTVFANQIERPAESRWNSSHVRASRGSALACVQTFPLGMRRLASTLDDFDIRHMQGYCGGRPNVVTAHICVAAYLEALRSVTTRSRASLKLMAAAERRFYRRYPGQVIAVSEKIARELRDFYQVQGPISVIPHGVDLGRFNSDDRSGHRASLRSQLGIDPDSIAALYVGDLTKSHIHLKEIASAAPEVQFIIVSSSRQYHWNTRNVRFLPSTAHLNRYYAMADTFVFPTSYDAFGMVILEAMACGLAVFSSNCAGAAELIHSGKDGFVIPLDDWVEATVAGLRDRDSLQAIGRGAEKTAIQHPWSTVVQEVEKVYFQISARSDIK